MKFSSIASSVAVGVLLFVAGLLIGRSQSDGSEMVRGEEVEERLVSILYLDDPLEKTRALSTFFAQLSPTNLELVESIYEAERPEVDEVARVIFAAWWARFDPGGAFGGRIPPNWGGDDSWSRTVMREWVRQDPATALEAALALPPRPEPVKLEALRSLVNGWFDHPDTDPDELLAIFDQLPDVRPRGELLILWVNRMIESRGVDYAIEYAESIPEDENRLRVKRELMGRLAAQLVPIDLERAVEFTERNSDTEAGSKTAFYMVSRWAHDEGAPAIEWAMASSLDTKDKTVERAWRSALIGDREAAMAWMDKQSYSEALEPAYALYLANLATRDHQRALELAAQVKSRQRLLQIWQAIGRAWIAEDPISAEAWMASLDLPPDVVRNIRARRSTDSQGRIPLAR